MCEINFARKTVCYNVSDNRRKDGGPDKTIVTWRPLNERPESVFEASSKPLIDIAFRKVCPICAQFTKIIKNRDFIKNQKTPAFARVLVRANHGI